MRKKIAALVAVVTPVVILISEPAGAAILNMG